MKFYSTLAILQFLNRILTSDALEAGKVFLVSTNVTHKDSLTQNGGHIYIKPTFARLLPNIPNRVCFLSFIFVPSFRGKFCVTVHCETKEPKWRSLLIEWWPRRQSTTDQQMVNCWETSEHCCSIRDYEYGCKRQGSHEVAIVIVAIEITQPVLHAFAFKYPSELLDRHKWLGAISLVEWA